MDRTRWQGAVIKCLGFHSNCLHSITANKEPQKVLKDSENIGTVPKN